MFATLSHGSEHFKIHDPTCVWVKSVSTSGFDTCVREAGSGSGGASVINWLAFQSIRHERSGLTVSLTVRVENSEVACFAVIIIHLERTFESVTSGLCRIPDHTFLFFFSFSLFFCVKGNCSCVTLCYLGETTSVCDCST